MTESDEKHSITAGGVVVNDDSVMDAEIYTKGEKQPNQCRDPFFAVLYYIHVVAIIAVAGVLGIPSLTKNSQLKPDASKDSVEVTGIVVTAVTSAFFTFLCGIGALFLMMRFATLVIQIALILSVVLSLLVAIASFATGNIVGGCLGLFFFLMSACYAWCVWSRIPFAAANLNVGLTAVKANCGLTVVAYGLTFSAIIYSIIWSVAVAGVFTQTTVCDASGNCTGKPNAGIMFMLFLSYFWAQQVCTNTIHVTVAGTVGTWWYAPEEANSCCSQGVKESLQRATTYSFGSICFGSLLVAIIQALRQLVENARNNDDGNAILLCLAECILACIQSIVEYFNKWAFIYVGLYGYSYLEAGKNVMTLFEAKGFSTIITDDLVGNALTMICLGIGLVAGLVGIIPAAGDKTMFAGVPPGSEIFIGFLIGFIVGVVISSITLGVVASSVNTVIVCYAEGPAEFQNNHPELSQEMKEAWQKAYPELANW
eukprot:CAMPEP_0172494472 /NCGR_PEP_ID=MMETSP1066-20121228/48731_1 /TAXON_ID=671091 /ORGANISM="Coscinodiscus wailesii, Strain CCMP2513" /LENGTH=482 /DNA_ID=CAMNT_0013265467 /DNA_START=86 /DNA_END=1531 /DNA_ORIENTATION=+